jgi:hypothetical protein
VVGPTLKRGLKYSRASAAILTIAEPYYTTEPAVDEDESAGPLLASAGPLLASSHDMRRMYSCFSGRPIGFRPKFVYELVDQQEKRAEQRLQEIDRRAYALELVEQDRGRIEARKNPERYLYPKSIRFSSPRCAQLTARRYRAQLAARCYENAWWAPAIAATPKRA